MTPDRLVDFIPSLIAELSPPALPENPGDAAGLCRWLDHLAHKPHASETAGIPNPLWPQPPQITPTRYTLAQAPQVSPLHLPAGIPVRFCNYPGHNFRGDVLPTLVRCQRVADHVIAVNGELAFSRTDFDLPGPFPFRWQRFYRQSSDTPQGLGHGWRHTLSESLQLPDAASDAERKVVLHTAEGRSIAFDLPAIGHATFNRCERLYLLRQSLHSFRIGGFGTTDKIFRADGTGHSAPLCEIRDASGNTLSVDYRSGQPHRIITSWGRTLECIFDGGHLTKIVDAQAAEDTPLCRYDFNEERQLISAEARHQCEHYRYENAQLTSVSSPAGTIRFSFDRIGRCHQLHHNALELKLHWQASRRRCTLSSADQHDIHWQFDERGNLIQEQQAQHETRFLYDHYRNLCLRQELDGQRTLFRHDEFGRLLRQTRNGHHRRFSYDTQGRLRTVLTSGESPEAARWTFNYGEQSQPISITDPSGQKWLCEYNERGQLQQLTDPESGITSLQWDGQSQLVALQRGDCHYRFTYDSAGRFTGCSGGHLPNMPDRHWHYDEKGLLNHAEIAGEIFSVTYDDQGRACAIGGNTSACPVPFVQWQNDEQNLVRHLRFAGGSSWNLSYDLRGRLSALETDGSRFLWHYDLFGRLREFSDSAGRQREWQYDASGRVSEYRDSDNHWYLEYRADGALEKIRNNNGQRCRFHFDNAGRLSQASNNDCHQRFHYDRCNRLLAEHHDVNIDNRRESLSIHYDYDARGWLRGAGSDEVNISYIIAASGAFYGVDVNGEMLLRTEWQRTTAEGNDSKQEEGKGEARSEKWSLGEHTLTRHYVRGLLQQIALGEHCQWKMHAASTIGGPPAFLVTHSDYAPPSRNVCDRRGNLVSEVRASASGPLPYAYQFDGWGLLHSAECGDFSTYFRYDPFGRRLAKTSSHRRSRRQRRVSSYWTSLGLWREISRIDENRTAAHFLHHPLDTTPLARLTRTDAPAGEEGRSIREERHFYVADDHGCLLALLDDGPAELPPRWKRDQEPSQGNTGPGAYRGGDGTLDGETQLYYRDFSYWHTDRRAASAPLDAGQCRLLASRHRQPGALEPERDAPGNSVQGAAAADDESITNPLAHL